MLFCYMEEIYKKINELGFTIESFDNTGRKDSKDHIGDFTIVKNGIKLDIKLFKNDDSKAIESKINSIIYPYNN